MLERSVAVRTAVRPWSAIQVNLGDDIVLPEAWDAELDYAVRLDVIDGSCWLTEEAHNELTRLLVNVDGVVPDGIERDALDCIGVPGAEPDEVSTMQVTWAVGERLRVFCRDEVEIIVRVDADADGNDVVDLGRDHAWALARALVGARTWRFDIDERQGGVGRELRRAQARLQEARRLVRGETPGGRAPLGTARLMARLATELQELERRWEDCAQAEAAYAGSPEGVSREGIARRREKFMLLASRRTQLADELGAAQLELVALSEAGREYAHELRQLHRRAVAGEGA